ncbi:MAG TPA: family 10 glycosylhydrolase [Halomicronema sp.]
MVATTSQFTDIQNHWARPFIEGLKARNIISGFPDGTFRPNQAMNRAEYAAILRKAFTMSVKRPYVPFSDVSPSFWGAPAIQQAYETGFISGFPDKTFLPNERITRIQVLVSLIGGLGITVNNTAILQKSLSEIYQDSGLIPSYATERAAIATGTGLVVNYPNLRLLRPSQSATRGEVVSFIYQALVYLGQVPKIPSDYIIIPPQINTDSPGNNNVQQIVKVSHTREFRGVWVTTVWNSDWPSKKGLSSQQQKDELIHILDLSKSLNLNAIVFQVRPEGDALYPSQLEPWSIWLTGTPGKAPEPYYDPLQFAIEECHKRNLEIHAWFNPYRAKTSTKAAASVRPHIAATNPECVYEWGNQLWMDPGVQLVQDRTYNVIMDVLNRYDIDGIHIDDYFYPYPIAGQNFPDSKTYADYKAKGGNLSLGDWRRENVNKMVKRLAEGIKSVKPYVKFGISPFGIYRPGQPPGSKGLDQYSELYADVKKWLQEGWLDYLAPQLYWRIDQAAQSYPMLLKWWVENNPKGKHIYTGNNLGLLDGKAWKIEEITQQVDISRNLKQQLSLGNIYFPMKGFLENRENICETFKASTYAEPALVPTMPHLDNTPPEIPGEVTSENGQISWNPATNKDIRSWTLYYQYGTTWKLINVLPVAVTSVKAPPGTYALCAVDKKANESQGIVITVK